MMKWSSLWSIWLRYSRERCGVCCAAVAPAMWRVLVVLLMTAGVSSAGLAQVRPHPAPSASDSIRQARVEKFIGHIADELPHLAAIRYATWPEWMWHESKTLEQQRQAQRLVAFGRPQLPEQLLLDWPMGVTLRASLPPVAWFDSLRVLWPRGGDSVRIDLIFHHPNELRVIEPVFLALATEGVAHAALERFATAALSTALGTAAQTELSDDLMAFGHLLQGTLALAQEDTARAIPALLASAGVSMRREEVAAASVPAARLLASVVEARHDTTALLIALTIQRLRQAPSWRSMESMVVDARLRELYPHYVAVHGMPPDVIPHRMDGEPGPHMPLPFDAYLDRQWTVLYDRSFPVDRAPAAPGGPGAHRLVVVEYETSIGCCGCFFGERVMSAVLRRYASDDVMLLTYYAREPGGNITFRLDDHLDHWYRSLRDTSSGLGPPRRTLTTAGDTLEAGWWVNGRGTLAQRRPERADLPLESSGFQRVAQRIDEEFTRGPDAQIQVAVQPTGEQIRVQVQVDSIRGTHRTLALRLALVEDTMWIHTGTLRRVYHNVVRAAAATDRMSLGIPLPAHPGAPIPYTFDLAAIQAGMLAGRNADSLSRYHELDRGNMVRWRDDYIARFFDPRDWQLNRARLSVVAFVQDLETGEVLQAARVKVPPMAMPAVSASSSRASTTDESDPVKKN